MTAARRAKLKKQLSQLEAELTGKGRVTLKPEAVAEDEVRHDEDAQPLNEMLQSIASSRNRNLEGVLGRVQRALTKLAEAPEDFGQCEDCGEDIASGRLDAMPYAELCVGCQAQKDGPRGLPTRRKITDFR